MLLSSAVRVGGELLLIRSFLRLNESKCVSAHLAPTLPGVFGNVSQ